MNRRRVLVTLTIEGSDGDAQAIQDAIGEAINDEFLGAIVSDVVQARQIANVDWVVKGERWQPADSPQPSDIVRAMDESECRSEIARKAANARWGKKC